MIENYKKEKLYSLIVPYIEEGLVEAINKKFLTKNNLKKFACLLEKSFGELNTDEPEIKVVRKNIKDCLLLIGEIGYEKEISDPNLRNAAKILKYKIIKKTEKEDFANCFARGITNDLFKLDEEIIYKTYGNNGLIIRILNACDKELKSSDKKLISSLVELFNIFFGCFVDRFNDEEFDKMLKMLKNIIDRIEVHKSIEPSLIEFTNYALEKLQILKCMRSAFVGLLLGDIILFSITQMLGLKRGYSVTDIIIYLCIKIFETQYLPKVDRNELRKAKQEISALLQN